MKQRIFQLTAAAALAAGMAFAQTTPAPAQPAQPGPAGQHGMRRGMGMMRQRMVQALNLTDAQKQQAKTIFQQTRQTAKPIADQLKQNREALAAAIKANNVAQIDSLSAQQGVLRGQLLAARSEGLAKFYSILTPDQKAKADQIHENMKQRMQQRMQNRQQKG